MAFCPLCNTSNDATFYQKDKVAFFQCSSCNLIYKDPTSFPTEKKEKERYLLHNNDPNDPAYQQFVSPIVEAVLKDFSPKSNGLDFGAGTGPVISEMLSKKGYSTTLYDTFFHPYQNALKHHYNFIICCEVIEHFHHPNEEFLLLKRLLKPKGKLYCMTELFRSDIQFEEWHYKNDETHVIFYTEETLKWIQRTFTFSEVKIDGRLIVFST